MKPRVLYVIVPLTALLCAFFIEGIDSIGASQRRLSQSSNFSDLTLKIAAPKKEVLQLEPLPLVLELSNETDHSIMGHTALDFSFNHINLLVRQSGGSIREVKELSPSSGRVIVSERKIESGERHESKQVVTINLAKIFPQPGSYEVQAVLFDVEWQEQVKSNIITINIVRPQGIDREAFEFIEGQSTAPYFFCALEITTDANALRALEEFEANFGESGYGDYASFQLGRFYFFQDQFAKARVRLEKIAKRGDFVFSGAAADYLEKMKVK